MNAAATQRNTGPISVLAVRSLVAAFSQALESSDPEPVVFWAQTARATYPPASLRMCIEVVAAAAAGAAESLELDFSAVLVFIEILKTQVFAVVPREPGRVVEHPAPVTNSVIDGVLAMLKAHDEATCAHSHATGAWCRRIAEAMNLSAAQTDFIVKAGILHDIGKIGTPDEILFKNGPLTGYEWSIMQRHAEFGAQILSELPALAPYAPIVRAHHERWDGAGYPNNLKGDQIPFEARVVAVADAFHAMISNRPYRPAIAQRDAMAILREGRGTQWDATVVDTMIEMLEAPRHQGTRKAARG